MCNIHIVITMCIYDNIFYDQIYTDLAKEGHIFLSFDNLYQHVLCFI